MAAALSLGVMLCPWTNLRLKCLLAALAAYYASDIVLCLLWYALGVPSPLITLLVQGGVFLGAALIYAMRSYQMPSDELKPGYLYCVRKIPSNTQDMLISMATSYGPDGAYSLYIDGHVYKFAAGRLVKRKVSQLPSNSYHVIRGGKIDQKLKDRLDSLVGIKWSLKKNCLTVLGKIWREHSGRPY